VLADTAFFNAVTPLLPHYVDRFGLSGAEAGFLTAAYPLGTLVAAVPAGLLASKAGVKATVLVGLAGLALTSLLFGLATNLWVLDISRFIQGMSGSCTWTGSLAWLVGLTPPERRGQALGTALGTAIAGLMLGSALGGLASAVGTAPAFAVVAVGAVVLAILVIAQPDAPAPRLQSVLVLGQSLMDRRILTGAWFVLLPALISGTLYVLAPLRLADLGFSGFGVAATFFVAALLGAAISPGIGRLADRRGVRRPLVAGLLISAAFMVLIPWPGSAWGVACLAIALSTSLSLLWTPGFSMLTEASDAFGLDYALAFALMSLAWAPGQAVGSAASGALSSAVSEQLPYFCLAFTAIASIALLRHRSSHRPLGRT
jgi:predicted MFS family arabinose efflux permease